MADSIRRIKATELSRITGVPRSTRVSWVERQAIEEPEGGAYEEKHVVETAIFARLTSKLETNVAHAAWLDARSSVLATALRGPPGRHKRLDLLVNAQTAALDLVNNDQEIGRIARVNHGEPHVVVPVARSVNAARAGYWRYARLVNASGRGAKKATENDKRESAQSGR